MTATDTPRLTPGDHLRSRKKPRIATVRIPMDSEIADAYEEAKNTRDLARYMLDASGPEHKPKLGAELEQAQAAYEDAKAAITEASTKFTFRAIGRTKYDRIVNDNPKTSEQEAKEDSEEVPREDRVSWNPETFPLELVAASIVEPKLTREDVFQMWNSDDWSTAELSTLFGAAMSANAERQIITLGKD